MKIAILLASYNGEKFIRKQLDSIEKQTYKDWCLYILDDGSTDSTRKILQEYQTLWNNSKIKIFQQTNQGSTKTFLTLVCDPTIQADYYAYSDQDDVWDNDKLERAIKILKQQPHNKPQLYFSSARLINSQGQEIGKLPDKKQPFTFEHALVGCASTGNTMVFNQAARGLIQTVGAINLAGNHDWWTYLAVSACESYIYYEPTPTLSYRLHSENVVGFESGYLRRIYKRFLRVMDSEFIKVNDAHIAALTKIEGKMSVQAKKTLFYFKKSRRGNFLLRLFYLYKSKVYRQETTGTIGLYIAVFLKKF